MMRLNHVFAVDNLFESVKSGRSSLFTVKKGKNYENYFLAFRC